MKPARQSAARQTQPFSGTVMNTGEITLDDNQLQLNQAVSCMPENLRNGKSIFTFFEIILHDWRLNK
jgi:hypothetical protein